MVNTTIILLELEKSVWSPIWTKPTLGILFGRSHVVWSPIITIFSSPAAAASAGRKWGRDGKWGIVQIIVSQLGGFVKIIGSRLLTAIQFRGICANNRIAIINRDPNEGVICKICG
jgi:hypothetical protein